MIESLYGRVLWKAPDHVVLECHGVGYRVMVPASVSERIPAQGECRLHVHYTVTVDVRSGQSEHKLHGFLDPAERQLFRRLIEVQGVSSALGLAVLGAAPAADVERAIVLGDESFFRGVKGIGPKLAQRIIAELQGRGPLGLEPMAMAGSAGNTLHAEALSALVSLGLDRAKADRALHAVLRDRSDAPPSVEELIKLTLKNL
jgi:Holliday junction DNA helicase RuvA